MGILNNTSVILTNTIVILNNTSVILTNTVVILNLIQDLKAQ